jgi:hypothetical protein
MTSSAWSSGRRICWKETSVNAANLNNGMGYGDNIKTDLKETGYEDMTWI